MTENEAQDMLDRFWEFAICGEEEKVDILKNVTEAVNMAIQALEEIQQYRELGTVEEILKVFNNERTIIATQHETVKQYRAIGTIEEFKALKEKSEPKKPIYSDFEDNGNDEIIPYKAICPICGYQFEFGHWNEEESHHCRCGQNINWQWREKNMAEIERNVALTTLEDMQTRIKRMHDIAHSALTELEQYRAIGTIEEFRALKEKNTPMELAEHNFQDEPHHYLCPICRNIVSCNQNYCEECGQALET